MAAQRLDSMHIFDGNMHAVMYQIVLADHLIPSIPHLSTEQDSETCHTDRSSMQLLVDSASASLYIFFSTKLLVNED